MMIKKTAGIVVAVLPPYRKTGSEPLMQPASRRLWLIFKPKRSRFPPRTVFSVGQCPSPHRLLSLVGEGIKTILHPSYLPDTTPAGFLLLPESKIWAGWPLIVQDSFKAAGRGWCEPPSKRCSPAQQKGISDPR